MIYPMSDWELLAWYIRARIQARDWELLPSDPFDASEWFGAGGFVDV